MQPLLGRDRELSALRELVRGLTAGRGAVVFVEGEPGIGKSVLLAAGLAGAQEAGCVVVRGNGDELTQRSPLRVALSAFRIESRSAEPERAEVAAVLRGQSPLGLVEDPVAAATEQLVPLIERLAARAPHVVVFDDLQWVDDESLRLWQRLASITDQTPLLVVGASRLAPDRDEVARARAHAVHLGTLLTLEAFGPDEVSRLVAMLAGAKPGAGLARWVQQAAGNPMYIYELVDALRRDHRLVVDGGIAELTREAPERVPASLAVVIARRIEAISAEAASAVRLAALLGVEFSASDLAAILDRASREAHALLREAQAAAVLVEAEEDRLRFRHPLLRQALYDNMSLAMRAGLHKHAARALVTAGAAVDVVADQLVAAGGGAEEWLLEWLVAAMPVLVSRSLEVATELISRALDGAAADDIRRDSLAAGLARAMFLHARGDDGESCARDVLAHTSDSELAAEMREMLSNVLGRRGDVAQALDVVREGLGDPKLPPKWRARLTAQLAQVEFLRGEIAAAEAAAEAASNLGRSANDRYALGSALLWLAGINSHRGDVPRLLEFLGRGLNTIGDDPECVRLRLILLYNLVVALAMLDRFADAETALAEVRELAERVGGGTVDQLHVVMAGHHFAIGRWDDAVAEIEIISDLTSPDSVLLCSGLAALIAVCRDDRAGVEVALKRAADVPMTMAVARANSGYVLCARALLEERGGDVVRAVTTLALVLDPEYSVMANRYEFLPTLVRLGLTADNRDVAEQATATCEADSLIGSTPGKAAALSHCHGLLDNDAEPLLRAATHYRGCDRQPKLAQVLVDAAVILASGGRVEEARVAFAEAVELYAGLAAVWEMRRADARLRQFGIRRGVRGPRQRPSSGFDALSPTERAVADFVAAGRSNPDIAGELLLSRRTVQTHVSHILVKLGARSRVEIARRVAEHAARP